MLHIITPLYRYENLEKIYYSILLNDDITWHISKIKSRKLPKLDFLSEDKRIKLYEIEADDTETCKKRNVVLESIKNGYFCFLDDDTLFHESMYEKYLQCKNSNFVGMLVGSQIGPNGEIRLNASHPVYQEIDTGNVLCHFSVLTEVKWPCKHIEIVSNKDFLFWSDVYRFYDFKCALTDTTISFYNKISGRDELQTTKNSQQKNKINNKRSWK